MPVQQLTKLNNSRFHCSTKWNCEHEMRFERRHFLGPFKARSFWSWNVVYWIVRRATGNLVKLVLEYLGQVASMTYSGDVGGDAVGVGYDVAM